jgi:hypothetical protein
VLLLFVGQREDIKNCQTECVCKSTRVLLVYKPMSNFLGNTCIHPFKLRCATRIYQECKMCEQDISMLIRDK